jgi:hypothetical protein
MQDLRIHCTGFFARIIGAIVRDFKLVNGDSISDIGVGETGGAAVGADIVG